MRPLAFLSLLVVCVFFLTSLQTTTAVSPGLITSISAPAINQIINQILPVAIDRIKETPIEDVSSGHTTISNIVVNKVQLSSFEIGTRDNSKVFLSLSRLTVGVKCHFRYKNGILSVSGDIRGSATGSGTLAAMLQPENDKFKIQLTQADININDFDLHISGGLMAKVLNAIKSVFQGLVKRSIKNKMAGTIRDAIINIANRFGDSIPSSYTFGTAGHIISLAPAAFGTRYDSNSVSVAFNGSINNAEVERHNIDTIFAPSGALFDIFIDVFVFNSGCQAIPFKVMTYNSEHPGSLPVPGWFGKDWGLIIPIMAIAYPDSPVHIEVSLLEKPIMTSINGQVSLTAVGGYRIFAGDVQIALIKASIGGGVTVMMEKKDDGKQYIVPQFQQVGVRFEIIESISGDIIIVGILETVLNMLTQIATGVINSTLLNGIVIPSVQGLEFVNPRIDFPPGAIRFATDISFTPFEIV
jgi:hypothetical protein